MREFKADGPAPTGEVGTFSAVEIRRQKCVECGAPAAVVRCVYSTAGPIRRAYCRRHHDAIEARREG